MNIYTGLGGRKKSLSRISMTKEKSDRSLNVNPVLNNTYPVIKSKKILPGLKTITSQRGFGVSKTTPRGITPREGDNRSIR
jgi:hypothetical protein